MTNRKTTLKQLEHINLSGWGHLNKVDEIVRNVAEEIKSRRAKPGDKISAAATLAVFEIWGIPSTEVTLETAFEKALSAGEEYTSTPGIAPWTKRHRDEYWLHKVLSLMVVASLQNDDTALTRFSNWFKVENYSYGEPYYIAHQPILYYVADMFRKKKFASYEKLNKFLASCRVKEPPLLMSALEGIRSMDSKKAFNDLITAVTDHAQRANIGIPRGALLNVCDIVAMYPSLLWNVAELRGLQPPSIPPEIRPFMLTRQTLGLPPIQAAKTSEASKPKTANAKSAKAKTANTKTAKTKTAKTKTAKTKTAKTKIGRRIPDVP